MEAGKGRLQGQKSEIRKRMIYLRESLSADEVQRKSKAIRTHLEEDPVFQQARSIHCYISFRNEVDTHGLIADALGRGIRVVVPLSGRRGRTLVHCRIVSLDKLGEGHWGVPIPRPSCRKPACLKEVDVVLVPGVAFDMCGGRIGFGGGFYDRFLPSMGCTTIGLAYGFQVVAEVPTDAHDWPVDRIATEAGICGTCTWLG